MGVLAARFESAFGLVALLVFCTFVLDSLVPYHGWGGVAITTLGTTSATVALGTARVDRPLVLWASRFAAVSIAFAVSGAITGESVLFAIAALLAVSLLLVGALAVLRAVVTEEKVGFRTILGAVSVYLILGLIFAFVYVSVDRIQGQPFFGTSADVGTGDTLFFSMTTLTTTGYGDLVPAAQPGKMLANVEMLLGQIFLVTLIARLVSMWRPGQWLRDGAGIERHRRGGSS